MWGTRLWPRINAPFDMSFILKHGADAGLEFDNACMDTLWLIKRTFPGHKSYSLGKLAAEFGIELRHHRALDDATATAKLMALCIEAAGKPREHTLTDEKNISTNHIILLCRNATGLFNLYKLVSESHLHHFYRKPRVPKSLLIAHREGLIIGSACEQGELIQAILRFASDGELMHIAKFYDYLEIQPDGNNAFMVREGRFKTMEGVRDITRRIVRLGEELGLPVAAHLRRALHRAAGRILPAHPDAWPEVLGRRQPGAALFPHHGGDAGGVFIPWQGEGA